MSVSLLIISLSMDDIRTCEIDTIPADLHATYSIVLIRCSENLSLSPNLLSLQRNTFLSDVLLFIIGLVLLQYHRSTFACLLAFTFAFLLAFGGVDGRLDLR